MQFLGLVGKLLGSNVAFGTIDILRQQKDRVGGFKKLSIFADILCCIYANLAGGMWMGQKIR